MNYVVNSSVKFDLNLFLSNRIFQSNKYRKMYFFTQIKLTCYYSGGPDSSPHKNIFRVLGDNLLCPREHSSVGRDM